MFQDRLVFWGTLILHPVIWGLFFVMNAITIKIFEVRSSLLRVSVVSDSSVRTHCSRLGLRVQIVFKRPHTKDEAPSQKVARWRQRRQGR